MPQSYHEPVLLDASIGALKLGGGSGDWMDATFGGGGHSRVILERLNKDGRLYGFDQDPDARVNTLDDDRFHLVEANFRYAKQFLSLNGVKEVDGILADLGVSSHQFDTAERGFSLRMDGPLDMRMNPEVGISAAELIKESSWEELMVILRNYGEVNRPDRVARFIVESSKENGIETTKDLTNVLSKIAPGGRENKFYAQVFQALLKPGGRLVVISYHSLEDRLVKHFMRSGNFDDVIEKDIKGRILSPYKLISRKAIVADSKEVMGNPRARSARLRVAERTTYMTSS
jgi:16S rRNA (cytosine1402-N4)-methyltransferase